MAVYHPPLAKGSFTYSGHGVQDHGSRKVGNWYSDHATDLMTRALASVFAVEPLEVTGVTRRASTGSGVNDGSTVFARGASGEEYAFLHLDPTFLPRVGQKLGAGMPFARVAGGTAGGPHLHFATRKIDPDVFVKSATSGVAPIVPPGGPDSQVLPPIITTLPGTVSGIGDAITAVPDFLRAITNPHNILRGLQIVAGAILVLVGLVLLVRQVALAADVPIPTPNRVPLPGGRDLYQSPGYTGG